MKAIFKIHHKALPWHYSTYRIIIISPVSLSFCAALPLKSEQPRGKFKIIDFRLLLKFMLKYFLFMFVSAETNCRPPRILPVPSNRKAELSVKKKSNQSHNLEQNNIEWLKIIVVNSWNKNNRCKSFVFLAIQKSFTTKTFLSKVHLKVFSWQWQKLSFECVGKFSPHFPCWQEYSSIFYAIVVCGCRRMFTIIWNTLRRSINVTMPTAHIFAIFHHNFFVVFSVCSETTFFAAVSSMEERQKRTWKNSIQQFLKIEK